MRWRTRREAKGVRERGAAAGTQISGAAKSLDKLAIYRQNGGRWIEWDRISVPLFTKIPFFEGLTPGEAETFARGCAWKRFDQGELMVDFEDCSTDVYFIVSGKVRVLMRGAGDKEMIFGDLGPDQFFGEMAAIDGEKRSANVTALTKVETCIMPASVFKSIIFSTPAICERLLKLMTNRLRASNVRLFERSVLDLRHRLYAELLRLAHPRHGVEGQSIISPPPLQQDSRGAHWMPPRADQPRDSCDDRTGTGRKGQGRSRDSASQAFGEPHLRRFSPRRTSGLHHSN